MMTGKSDRRTLLPAIVAAAIGVAGCGSGEEQGPPAPEVTVSKPVLRDVVFSTEFTGTTRAVESAEVRARVNGMLERITFEPATIVQEGQLLFVIEQEQYRAARDEALGTMRAAVADSALKESNLERVLQAAQTEAVSEQDVDKATAERDAAIAAVLGARGRLSRAQLDLDYTEVRSPITGQVGRNLWDAGNLVGHGEPTLLTTVNKIDPIFVYFDAPESLVLALLEFGRNRDQFSEEELAEYGKAYIGTAADEAFPHEGKIDFVGNTVDPTTGTIELRAALPNSDGVLFPGLFVRVRLPGRLRKDAVLVRETAVGTDLGGKYVMVIGEGNLVEQRYLTLGQLQDDGMIVVTDGLDSGETYVSNGLLRARPGFPVTPLTEEEMAARLAEVAAETGGAVDARSDEGTEGEPAATGDEPGEESDEPEAGEEGGE
jgi:RND family efflux transporter MFP subunit